MESFGPRNEKRIEKSASVFVRVEAILKQSDPHVMQVEDGTRFLLSSTAKTIESDQRKQKVRFNVT